MKFIALFEALVKEKNKLKEFLETRSKGAAKIEKSAHQKGGLSLLTAAHFKAKHKPYKEAIKHSDQPPLEECKQKALKVLDQLKDIDNLSQNEWQKLTGELEAYGECYIESKKHS